MLVADLGLQRSPGSHLPTGFHVTREQQSMLDLCAAVDAITIRGDPLGRPSPARLEQGEQIVAGSHNIRTEEGAGGGGYSPQV